MEDGFSLKLRQCNFASAETVRATVLSLMSIINNYNKFATKFNETINKTKISDIDNIAPFPLIKLQYKFLGELVEFTFDVNHNDKSKEIVYRLSKEVASLNTDLNKAREELYQAVKEIAELKKENIELKEKIELYKPIEERESSKEKSFEELKNEIYESLKKEYLS